MKKSYAYNTIVFLQGDSAEEALDILKKEGVVQLIDYLSDWDYGDSADIRRDPPWGTTDKVTFLRGYYVAYNKALEYVSLVAPVTKREYIEGGIL